jgi:hypothetical protein
MDIDGIFLPPFLCNEPCTVLYSGRGNENEGDKTGREGLKGCLEIEI